VPDSIAPVAGQARPGPNSGPFSNPPSTWEKREVSRALPLHVRRLCFVTAVQISVIPDILLGSSLKVFTLCRQVHLAAMLSLDDSVADGEAHQFGDRMQVQLPHNIRPMGVDGFHAHA